MAASGAGPRVMDIGEQATNASIIARWDRRDKLERIFERAMIAIIITGTASVFAVVAWRFWPS